MRQCLAKRPPFYRIGMVMFPRNPSDPNCVGILLVGGTELAGGHACCLYHRHLFSFHWLHRGVRGTPQWPCVCSSLSFGTKDREKTGFVCADLPLRQHSHFTDSVPTWGIDLTEGKGKAASLELQITRGRHFLCQPVLTDRCCFNDESQQHFLFPLPQLTRLKAWEGIKSSNEPWYNFTHIDLWKK